MLLKKLTLRDYKTYKGCQTLDLTIDPASEKNLIIIGGLNGAGKTSLLDGIRLTLYGAKDKEVYRSQNQAYAEFISGCLNEAAFREGVREFSISLDFEVESIDEASTLSVERTWYFDNKGNYREEKFILRRDGLPVDTEDQEDADDYIQDLIPLGISKFFFFDGEKIQTMAEDDGYESKLVDAVRDILDITLYRRLVTDLEYYERTILNKDPGSQPSELKTVEADLAKNEERRNQKQERINELIEETERLEDQGRELQTWIRHHGSRWSVSRVEVQAKMDDLRLRKEELQERLADSIGNELPYVICHPLLRRLERTLAREEEVEKHQLLARDAEERVSEYVNTVLYLPPFPSPRLEPEQVEFVANRMREVWKTVFTPLTPDASNRIHDGLSSRDKEALRRKIAAIQTEVQTRLAEYILDLDAIERELRKLNHQAKWVPDDSEFVENEQRLKQLNEQVGANKQERFTLEVERDKLLDEYRILQRKRDEVVDKVALTAANKLKIQVSRNIRRTLEEFIDSLTAKKAVAVENYLADMFQRLAWKRDVREFHINPKTFQVTIHGQGGAVQDKKRLSAGEKEIFAVSLLWALSRATNRALPIVIDTPLGRLDGRHRNHIAKRYLPEANRQVILLSHDKEIDRELFRELTPFIVKTFILDFDEKSKVTTVKQGYFFGGEPDGGEYQAI